jgi:Zn-dependent M28 family amino/carboxypeptidase
MGEERMMKGTMTWVVRPILAMVLLCGAGCGGKDGGTDEPDTDAGDAAGELDVLEDPDVPEEEALDAPDVTDPIDDDDDAPEAVTPVDCSAIEHSMTREGLLVHLEAIEAIAVASDGNRVVGTPGWEGTIDYVEDRLEEYGYAPARTDVTYSYFEEETDPVLSMVSPTAADYTFSEDDPVSMPGDFQRMHLSRPGDVSALVTAVDLDLGLDNTSTSGCEPGDFDAFTPGHIALIQRGTCPYVIKANNADDAGASAIIIFNQGDTTERTGLNLFGVGLIPMAPEEPEHGVDVPIVYATYAVGEGIATALASGPVVMRVIVSDVFEIRPSQNLLAETSTGDPDDVVVYGASLDSHRGSPGLNNNASGVAGVLEIARLVAECDSTRRMRFAFWATDKQGMPWGSLQYLASLSGAELDRISMYLGVDTIGSSNHVYFVFDGDGSDYFYPGPEGSAELEYYFVADLMLHGYPSIPFFGPTSDHDSFIYNDIPYAWVYTGGSRYDGLKTEEQAALFGGTAGEMYHPCDEEACDTIENMNMDVAEVVAKSYARSAQFFGLDGHSVTLP